MTDRIEIQPTGPMNASIRPPGSKSITNRALICAALAKGTSALRGPLDSEDTRVMVESLRRLGIDVRFLDAGQTFTIRGCEGQAPVDRAELFVGNSGTTVRFLTAALTTFTGQYRLDGVTRMRERPIGDLLDALHALGAEAVSEAGNDCPPVVMKAAGLRGGTAHVRGNISSQFLSGLLMACPNAQQDVTLIVDGELVSKPYVHMTRGVMSAFGVDIQEEHGLARFRVPAPSCYQAREYDIEPDASAASYFWGAAAITGGTVNVLGLNQSSLQGDVAFCECLRQMGCRVSYEAKGTSVSGGPLQGINVNMNAISDTVQTLAAVSLFAKGTTTITGVAHIRHKETDRIADLARELRKFGAEVRERDDGLQITPGELRGAQVDTYDDHRMAMSLALPGLQIPGVVVKDPACTGKTYPRFFADLAFLGDTTC
ncbi:MAG: 3-phosphoshikimate 1-carboxyvinyltransferase [Pirellulaceae bacterium]